ncbi:aldo-keto reductase family 1 member A1 [Scaptodrosophila lebanonensis]|uniref:Aldo-keto reductase family 1 member A1 n=1 Tax=Drosophila lebanonensis TaxID=7225 RepID=A0A6J2T7B3_DROLE|nr:aldo-keto reductase family 1 member A1 [Scaptodrosophila lebanonensis]
MACTKFLTFNNGLKMPILGIGTWQASDEEIETAIDAALEAGYRHIDTAPVYENEKAIGRVLKRWLDAGKLKREDLFIVTKLPPPTNRPHEVEPTIKKSLADLQLEYVDLYLIHTPFTVCINEDGSFKFKADGTIEIDPTTNHVATWAAMEKLIEKGLAKSIGVSNFSKEQVQRILNNCKIRPANNQVEHHVYLQQRDLIDYCKAEKVTVTAYSPLGSKGIAKLNASVGLVRELPDLLDIEEVKQISAGHGKTPAQVLLRWIIDCGVAAIPKSTNPNRLKQNLDIFDFELSPEEVAKLCALDQNLRICDFSFFRGVEKHPEFTFKNKFNN